MNVDSVSPLRVYPGLMIRRSRLALFGAALFLSSTAQAGEKKLMHCFAWTSVTTATKADWDAFFKASAAVPSKIRGRSQLWYSNPTSPLSQYSVHAQGETQQKLPSRETVTAPVPRLARD